MGQVSGSRRHRARTVNLLDSKQLLFVGLVVQQRTQPAAAIGTVRERHSAHFEVTFPAQGEKLSTHTDTHPTTYHGSHMGSSAISLAVAHIDLHAFRMRELKLVYTGTRGLEAAQ